MNSSIVLGEFDLLQPLNKGGMGEVWLGRHRKSSIQVAVKVITAERVKNQYFHEAFRNEVRMAAGLDHPGVVMVLDYGAVTAEAAIASGGMLVQGSPYLVQEYASSGSLMASRKRVMAWPELRAVMLALLDALGHAHARGVIHQDLKPGNVLVCSMDDLRPGLKVCDFGVARVYEDPARPEEVERVRGTLHYMAPEQCSGQWRDQGPWTDLYALGVMAYALASGRLPFSGRRGKELLKAHLVEEPPVLPNRRGIPQGFAAWLRLMMKKDVCDRFRSAADASHALCALAEPEDPGPREWVLPDLAMALGITDTVSGTPPSVMGKTETEPIDAGELETVMASVVSSVPENQETSHIHRCAPPIPRTWRAPRATPPSFQLVGAGLGLFGLRPIPLVGREDERDQLWHHLTDVHRTARPRLVFLTGPAGAGASRLSEWIGHRASELGAARTLVISHTQDDGPWESIVLMLERLLRTKGLPRHEIRNRIQDFLVRRGQDPAPDLEALTALFMGEFLRGRQELAALVGRFLRCCAWERPILLRVENIQWGREILEVLKNMLDDGMSDEYCPMLAVVTLRDRALVEEPGSPWAPNWLMGRASYSEVVLGSLSRSEREELTKELLGLDAKLAVRVEQLCGGNPMFAVELVGDWVSRGVLEVSEQGFSLKSGVQLTLPDSLHAVWNDRISSLLESLPDEASVFLERAATLGERVQDTEWALVCRGFDEGLSSEDAAAVHRRIRRIRQQLTDRLYELRLAIREDGGWRFNHLMLRESVLRRAAESGRLKEHHEICAQFLRYYGIPSAPGYHDRLGKHLQAIEQAGEALEAMLQAAESWSLAHEHGKCLDVLARCDELLDALGAKKGDPRRGLVSEKRAHCHFQRGEFGQADLWMKAAINDAVSRGDNALLVRLYLDCVRYAWTRGQSAQAEEWMSMAKLLLPNPIQGSLGLMWFMAQTNRLMRSGQLNDASDWATRAVAFARELADDHALGLCLRDQGTVAYLCGDFTYARERFAEARVVQEQVSGLKEIANTANRQGECERWAGDVVQAETFYKEAVSIYRRAGASFAGHLPLINLGLLYTVSGRFRKALVPLTQALAMVERQGNEGFQVITRILLLPCCAKVEDWAGWNLQIEQAGAIRAHVSLVEHDLVFSVRTAAELAETAGRFAEASQACELAIWMYEVLRDFDGRAQMLAMDARLRKTP